MAWVYRIGTATFQGFLSSAAASGANYDSAYFDTGTSWSVYVNDAGVLGGTFNANTWYHACLRRNSATSLELLVDGTVVATNTTSVAARAAITRMRAQNNPVYETADWLNGRLTYSKAWSAALTNSQIAAERLTPYPVRLENLYACWLMRNGAAEHVFDIAKGRAWTQNGTLTEEADPPIFIRPYKTRGLMRAAAGVSGTIAVTLNPFSPAMSGTTTLIGAIANTLGNFTSSITGTTTILGTISNTLSNFVSSITGTTTILGTISNTLGNFVSAISGSVGGVTGTIAAVLDSFVSAIQGTTTIIGNIAVTLGNFISNFVGAVADAASRHARRMLGFIWHRP